MTKFSKKDRLEIIQTAMHELLLEGSIPQTRREALNLIHSISIVCGAKAMLNGLTKQDAVDALIQNIKLSF